MGTMGIYELGSILRNGVLESPKNFRGTTKLVKDDWSFPVRVLVANVPVQSLGQIVQTSRKVNRLWRWKYIYDGPQQSHKKVILCGFASTDEVPSRLMSLLQSLPDVSFQQEIIDLDYSRWGYQDILRNVLPEDLLDNAPSSFTQVGHIAQVNLREEYLPYATLIGQVLLSKNAQIKTVIVKDDIVDNEFRTLKFDLVAGDPNYNVQLHEQGCTFAFDFANVYWNSRLEHEHTVVNRSVGPMDVLVDVTSGVGPFAIPSAKQGTAVLANDLNPECIRWLQENVTLNNIPKDLVVSHVMDGAQFIYDSAWLLLQNPLPLPRPTSLAKWVSSHKENAASLGFSLEQPTTATQGRRPPLHVVSQPDAPKHRFVPNVYTLNLPHFGIDLLSGFRGCFANAQRLAKESRDSVLIERSEKLHGVLPRVHTYCFERCEPHDASIAEAAKAILERLNTALHSSYSLGEVSIEHARQVSPKKGYFHVSFQLSPQVVW